MSQVRLDKFLAQNGFGTRSEVKKLFKAGQVLVNGVSEKKSERKIDPDADVIVCCGKTIQWKQFVCLMFHKPAGCITATEDKNQKTVMDYISHDRKAELFPVGRLDKDTEGLLLITNDGQLGHELLAPKKHVEKEYYVEIDIPLSEEDIEQISRGITYKDETYKPAVYKKISDTSFTLVITEGKYHEIKRMMLALGSKVTYLKRLRMKDLVLDESLKPGEYRYLTEEEIASLKAI
jgi:16S rRNA pseudouridine516 synthase